MNEEYDIQQPVTDVTENTEAQPVEENEEGIELTDTASNEEKPSVKTYTDEELERIINERVNDILPTKIEREKRKIERTYRDKLSQYEETQSILSAGLGTNDITESNQKMREFYKEQGIDIPAYQKATHSDKDEQYLGERDAKEIIKLYNFDEMQEEANKLAKVGFENLTVREKATLTKLANELTIQKNRRELAKIGVKADVLENSKFKEFTSKFNSDVPIQDIYEMYSKVNNKESQKYEQIGSLKNNKEPYKKEYFTEEDIAKMTDKELEENWEAIRRFQTSGYKK